MTPLLLAPLGLLALAALVMPLLIHLRRRTEEVPLDFAAMRWLEALPRPKRRLCFDEWLLLALRLLLVALLALLLAQPAVLGWQDAGPRVLVAPGVDPAAARAAAGPDADMRWIASGFPGIDAAAPASAEPVSSLIRQFDAELPQGAPITIFVPQVLDGVDAEPLRLTRKVEWKIMDGADKAGVPPAPPSPAMAVRVAEGDDAAARYFRAAAAAWSEKPSFNSASDASLPPQDFVLVWLVPGPVPQAVTDWVGEGGTALLASNAEVAMPAASHSLWRNEAGRVLIEGGALGSGRLMRFTGPLVPSAMPELLSPDFAERLRDLVASPSPPPARVNSAAFVPGTGAAPYVLPPRELTPWLALLIALAFLAERLLATRRRRFMA